MFWAWAGPASQSLTFIDRALGRPGPPKPSLLSTGPGPARPPIPHFYREESLTFIDRARPARPPNPSLLLAKPLTSIGQTPHFYQPRVAQIHGWPKSWIWATSDLGQVKGPMTHVPSLQVAMLVVGRPCSQKECKYG